jgi:nitrogen regulatory protein P-II 1
MRARFDQAIEKGRPTMKNVSAIIDARYLYDVTDRLQILGATGLTVVEVHDFSQRMTATRRGRTYSVDFTPKLALEVVVTDGLVPAVIRAISCATKIDPSAADEIFVAPVEAAIRIGAGDPDDAGVSQ